MTHGVLEHFPHDDFRFGQKYLAKELRNLVTDDDVKYIFLQGPTGTGKTAIAGTIASWAGNSYYLSEQKVHQQQVYEEFPTQTHVVSGQMNYDCGEARDPPCPYAIPDSDDTCNRKPSAEYDGMFAAESSERGELFWKYGIQEKCPYFKRKANALEAVIACLNYSYFLREVYYSGDFGKRDVMICDEAHNVEQTLQDFLTFRVDQNLKEELGIQLRDLGDSIEDWEEWILGMLRDSVEARMNEMERSIERDWESESDVPQGKLMTYDMLDEVHCNIERFDTNWHSDIPWSVERTVEDGELVEVSFTPVIVAPYTENMLFDYADTVILMSASILDYDTLARSLGLKQYADNIHYFDVPSSFPPENRPIYYYDAPKVNHDNWDTKFPKVVQLLDSVCSNYHSDESGIVHTVSYRNGDKIEELVSDDVADRLIRHKDTQDRDKALKQLKLSDNGILLSPGMYEGVDLRGDQSRFQIVPKVPFLDLDSESIQKRRDIEESWYMWRTIIRLVQAVGRSVRSEEDYATTYILDGAFRWLYEDSRYSYLFPDYIEEAIERRDLRELL